MSSKVRYSSRANAEIEQIAAFTFQRWGNDQAESYIDNIYGVCRLIGNNSEIGRNISTRSKWRRLEHESHVILYSTDRSGITIQRILHKSQLVSSTTR